MTTRIKYKNGSTFTDIVLPVENGGTGATSALSKTEIEAMGTEIMSSIDSTSTTPLPIANGGTGARTAKDACNSLQSYYLGEGTHIPSGADLNNYTTPGVYEIPYGITLLNRPTENNTTARLVVQENASGITQEYTFVLTANTQTGGYKYARYKGDSWSTGASVSGIDSIVAEGNTSDGICGRKYANGFAEIGGAVKSTTYPLNSSNGTSYGSLYRSDYATITYPFSFKYTPVVVVTPHRDNYDIISVRPYNGGPNGIYLYALSVYNNSNVYSTAHFHAIGWGK